MFSTALFGFTLLSSLKSEAVIRGSLIQKETSKNTIYILNKRTNQVCTGTVIHPRVILTAGHCILNKEDDPFEFSNSIELTPGSLSSLKIQKAQARPGYCGATKGIQASGNNVNDVGYFLFEKSILPTLGMFEADLPLLASSKEDLDIAVSQAKDFELIGYGRNSTSTFVNQVYQTTAKYRYSVNTMATNEGALLKAKGVKPGQTSCFGDSGGPLYAIDGASRKTLIGVLTAIKAGGKLLERQNAEKEKLYKKARAKLEKKGINPDDLITTNANGCKINPLAAKAALPESMLLQVCGDKDTVQIATSVYPHLCWVQSQTGLTLDPNLKCNGDFQ